MSVVTESRKYQVVIPKQIRISTGIQPWQKLKVFCFGDTIEMMPVKDITRMRDSLPKLKTIVEREEEGRV